MANRTPVGIQIQTIPSLFPLQQQSFNLQQLDNFVTSLGVDYTHYKAQPSPIGKKDIGDYRRNDGDNVDTITSNGMIYTCGGRFTATTVFNERHQAHEPAAMLDPSQARLILPRFYNNTTVDDGNRIYLAPGDRLYISDPQADVLVSTYQEMEYEPNIDNVPQFPIVKMDGSIVDSRNIQYTAGVDFCMTSNGSIRWSPGGNNPGIDVSTGKGRVYSIRYLYKAYWYVVSLPHEIRITNVTGGGGVRSSERMAYAAIIMREFMYHNQNKGNALNQLESPTPNRVDAGVSESINPNKNQIFVDVVAAKDSGGTQS